RGAGVRLQKGVAVVTYANTMTESDVAGLAAELRILRRRLQDAGEELARLRTTNASMGARMVEVEAEAEDLRAEVAALRRQIDWHEEQALRQAARVELARREAAR